MNLATYTTSEYFPIFSTFYDSVKENKELKLYVLCLDDDVKKLIKNNNIKCKTISLEEIENFSKSLLKKKYKKISEKIGVYRLAYANYLLRKLNIDVHLIDSDTYFFSDISNLENIIIKLNSSISFCKHNFFYKTKEMNDLYGVYNAGYIYFRNDKNSFHFLVKYRKLCQKYISWEVKKNIKNTFADQTYLEELIKIFSSIKIINDEGVNCAPWNIGNYKIIKKNDDIYVNNKRLIFYHFSGIRPLFKKFFFFNLYHYNRLHLNDVKEILYKKYLFNLKKNLLKNINKNQAKTISFEKIINLLKKISNKDFLVI